MGILGLVTYTMDLARFHDYLESVVFVNGEYRRDLLHQHAVKVFHEASEQTKEVFGYLCLDEEDLEYRDPDDPEGIDDDQWYLMALAPHLQPNHILYFYKAWPGVKILEAAGWEKEDARELLMDQNWREKPSITTHQGSVFYSDKVYPIIRPQTGWMDTQTIKQFREKFIKAKPYFFEKPLPVETYDDRFIKWHMTDKNVQEAYQEVLQMLETALARGHEMLLTWAY